MQFPKIDTLFVRDENFKVTTELRNPVYASFKYWHVTEKIDGTNIRITLNLDGSILFGGRTDAAQLPTDLLAYLQTMFTPEKMVSCFWQDGPVKAILYGEGYGAGIQKGGIYRSTKSFRLFDVVVFSEDGNPNWLTWNNVEDVARKLDIKTATYLGDYDLDEVISKVKQGVPSVVAKEDSGQDVMAEGIVGRTIEPLFDRRGHRIILKLKTKDFA